MIFSHFNDFEASEPPVLWPPRGLRSWRSRVLAMPAQGGALRLRSPISSLGVGELGDPLAGVRTSAVSPLLVRMLLEQPPCPPPVEPVTAASSLVARAVSCCSGSQQPSPGSAACHTCPGRGQHVVAGTMAQLAPGRPRFIGDWQGWGRGWTVGQVSVWAVGCAGPVCCGFCCSVLTACSPSPSLKSPLSQRSAQLSHGVSRIL